MRIATVILALALVASIARAPRAEDPPAGGAAPAWASVEMIGDLAVSPDGKWLAGHSKTLVLVPTSGEPPVVLDVGKDELVPFDCEFSADSRWLVAPGRARALVSPSAKADRKQPVFVFDVTAPAKRKRYEVTLEEKELPKEIRKRVGSGMKDLVGGVRRLVPLSGSRMLFDRGSVDAELWDVATGGRSAPPGCLADVLHWDVSADGARAVVLVDGVPQVRDLKSGRVLATLDAPELADVANFVRHVAFSPDASKVVLVRCGDVAEGRGTRERWEFAVVCWSVTDGRRLWETPLGKGMSADELRVAPACAVVVRDAKLHVLAFADGTPLPHEFDRKTVMSARPSADGTFLWVAHSSGISKMPLPAQPPK